MTEPIDELAAVLASFQSQHEVAPFLEAWHGVAGMSFQLLPLEMEEVLGSSADYSPPRAGAGPVWLNLETDGRHGALVVYRARVNGKLYVLAPAK